MFWNYCVEVNSLDWNETFLQDIKKSKLAQTKLTYWTATSLKEENGSRRVANYVAYESGKKYNKTIFQSEISAGNSSSSAC